MTTDNTAITIEMKGDIFSPGFKTLICRFAAEESLGGWIRNGNGGVLVHLEGQPEAIQRFIIHLPGNLYPAFMLKELNIVKKSSPQYTGKSPSGKNFENLTEHHEFFHIKPDYAPCDNCLHEIHDPSSRRYCYPFWSCADCGPSYSALQRMPFVRKNTFLSAFPPCKNCEDERKDAKDSNHHFSELLSCPDCGPQLYFTDNKGVLLEDKNAICVARKSLNNGEIVTLQSIFGGFYMTVDGRSRKGLAALRMRNNIPCKPLGVIAKNMQVIRKYCQVSPEEEKLLQSPACPMVLLHLREDLQDDIISNLLLPDGQRTLGVSLPPTALFHLLFFHHKELDSEQNDIPEDPELLAVIQDNWFRQIPNPQIEILMKHLEPITDKFLCHDLHVGFNCSTSITAVRDGQARLFRRSRGYVPMPVYIKKNARKIIAAFGGDEHAAVALAYGKQIIPSQEIGNLCGANATQRLTELVDHLSVLYDCVPEAVVCDMNTHLFASQAAAAFAEKRHLPLLTVESHHAQALACMAESGLKRSMALILNESSKGPDSFLWGAEMLNVNLDSFQRMAAFMPVLSPEKNGSDRPALFLAERMMEAGFQLTDAWFKAYHLTHAEKEYLRSQEKIDSVKNHSAGALIKQTASALGVAPETVSYSGQCLNRLDQKAYEYLRQNHTPSQELIGRLSAQYYTEDDFLQVDWTPLFRTLADAGVNTPQNKGELQAAFFQVFTEACVRMAAYAGEKTYNSDIVLSGSLFQNERLYYLISGVLKQVGFRVHTPAEIPLNDAGLCVGQAYYAGEYFS